jgi:hypothetical protein
MYLPAADDSQPRARGNAPHPNQDEVGREWSAEDWHKRRGALTSFLVSIANIPMESAEPAEPEIARLVARYDGRVPRYTSYPTAPHFTPAIGPSVYARWLAELPETRKRALMAGVSARAFRRVWSLTLRP